MAVIKMDGYGHGAVQIAKLLEPMDYIWGYAVATLDEAILIKDACLKKPVLVLGCIFPDQWDVMIRNEIRMTVYSYEMAKEVSELAEAMGCNVYVHIKLDTGMARLGFQITKENADEIARISKLPNLVMEGMFTHFAKSDEEDKTFTKEQLEKYLWMKEELKKRNVHSRIIIVPTVPASLIWKKLIWILCVRELQHMECIRPMRWKKIKYH